MNPGEIFLKKNIDLLVYRGGLQECVLVAPHALQPSLSGPAVPDLLDDFSE